MKREAAIRITKSLPVNALVLDVGGGADPFPRATHVIDAVPYEGRSTYTVSAMAGLSESRYSKETWCQCDICDREPWPYPNQYFDYVTCSHLLEDVRDPIWVCSEMRRIAKAGYIETPSRILEQTRGVENPTYCGYLHHRWFVNFAGRRVEFQFKPHNLHTLRSAVVTTLSAFRRLNPAYETESLEWKDSFDVREVLIFNEQLIEKDLCAFAAQARQLPNLTISAGGTIRDRLRRFAYYRRLNTGRR